MVDVGADSDVKSHALPVLDSKVKKNAVEAASSLPAQHLASRHSIPKILDFAAKEADRDCVRASYQERVVVALGMSAQTAMSVCSQNAPPHSTHCNNVLRISQSLTYAIFPACQFNCTES